MTADDAYELLLGISKPVNDRWARVNPISEALIRDPGYPACLGVLRRRGLCARVDLGGGLFDDFVMLKGVSDGSAEQGR